MNTSKFVLTDRVAIVTGSGRGIGKGIALAFASAGANLVVAEIDTTTAEATAAEIREFGRRAVAVSVDARDRGQVEKMAQRVLEEFGRIDILVNNAGGGDVGVPALEITEDDWDKVITLNLKTVFLCSKVVGRVMVQQKKGSIINIASLAGFIAFPLGAHYGAAKAAIINLTKTLAVELAPNQIRVNAISPGVIATPLTDEIYRQRPQQKEERLAAIPLGHLGRPEDIAQVAVFLASDASDYVTGETIVVGGGIDSFLAPRILTELRIRKYNSR